MTACPLIAIVDDDASALEAALGLVRSLGFTAAGFEGGRQFLGSGLVESTACLLVDWRMADMNGLELHRALMEADRSIPTILMTGFWDHVVRMHAATAGLQACLGKPLQPAVLLACIREALGRG